MQLLATGYWLSVPNKSNTKNKAKDRYLPLIHADDADFTARSTATLYGRQPTLRKKPRRMGHPAERN